MATKHNTVVVERSEFEDMKSKSESFDAITKSIADMGMMIDGLTNADMAQLVISLSTEGLNTTIVNNLKELKQALSKAVLESMCLVERAVASTQKDAEFVSEIASEAEQHYTTMLEKTPVKKSTVKKKSWKEEQYQQVFHQNGELFEYNPMWNGEDAVDEADE